MKKYEDVPRMSLTPRTPMIIRIDWRAFHTYTRGFERPWSTIIRDGMTAAASALLKEIDGAKLAYLQSDEISILVIDYERLTSCSWFDKVAQKICSVAASITTAAFNRSIEVTSPMPAEKVATFDARCFVLPREDVMNYMLWRQRDATRNSVSMLAQSQFSHNALTGKSGSQMQDMLMLEKGINWNDLEVWKKRGWSVLRETREVQPTVFRSVVIPDWDIPIFSARPDYVNRFVNLDIETDEETT